jgi:hypothetical protein
MDKADRQKNSHRRWMATTATKNKAERRVDTDSVVELVMNRVVREDM